jgi:hypothetical protein
MSLIPHPLERRIRRGEVVLKLGCDDFFQVRIPALGLMIANLHD